MDPRHFFAELKRRNVYKVAVAYIVGGWALAQGLAQVLPVFSVPNWVIQLLVGAHRTGSADCARFGLGVRADAGGNQAHRRRPMTRQTAAQEKTHLDLCGRYRRSFINRIIFSWSLHGRVLRNTQRSILR